MVPFSATFWLNEIKSLEADLAECHRLKRMMLGRPKAERDKIDRMIANYETWIDDARKNFAAKVLS